MAQNLLGAAVELGFIDKRKSSGGKAAADPFTHQRTRYTLATCNATGTTTTAVCANATPGTENATTNVVRIGDTFRIFAAGSATPKEETVFKVTGVAVAGSTTITFTPAAAVAPVNTDILQMTGLDGFEDEDSLDGMLAKLDATTYTATYLQRMTQNDKVYAARVLLAGTEGL